MTIAPTRTRASPPRSGRRSIAEPEWLRIFLIVVAASFLIFFLIAPLAAIFREALRGGWSLYLSAFADPHARAAIWLTLLAAVAVVPLNTLFGLAAAWCVTKFRFRGKSLLLTVIDLPFAVSPVIAGMLFVLLFSGTNGWFGPWIVDHGIRIIFAPPGIILATLFITLPFVARELIPLMQSQGSDEEYAAITLGASGWRTFRMVTLPNVKWALFYGIVLCNARALGEFGAVTVVSGNIKGRTSTLPLYIETLYMEYQGIPAFALASLLALFALCTLLIKNLIELRTTTTGHSP